MLTIYLFVFDKFFWLTHGIFPPLIGVPSLLVAPPSSLLISENSNFTIKIQIDCNPKPMALLTWSHDKSKTSTIAATQIYPFIYEAIFTSNNIPAIYCGRTFDTRIINSVGTSSLQKTNVTVSCKYCRLMLLRIFKRPVRGWYNC